jgi:hypothetical protein
MALVKFNYPDAFKEVFGISSRIPLFVPQALKRVQGDGGQLPSFPEGRAEDDNRVSSPDRIAQGGVIVPDRLRFGSGASPTGIYRMPIETVAEYHRAKNIVKTPMRGLNNTVKEYISLDDWNIVLRGFIINYESVDYPLEEQVAMNDFFEINKALEVTSEWMSSLGIDYVVTTDIRFPPMEGHSNVCPFEITMLSDSPVEYELLVI